jgi:hypothetical protein
MGNDGIGAPLSRRVPGEARPGPGQPVRPVLPESVLNRMQAAIEAEHAQAEVHRPGEPNTEPLPRVSGSASPSRRGARRAASPSGLLPEADALPDQTARPEGAARPSRAAKPPRADEPLRVAKALRAADELQAAAAARVHAAEPEPLSAVEPEAPSAAEPLRRAEPAPLRAAEQEPVAVMEAQPPRAAEPPRVTIPTATAAYDSQPTPGSIGWLWPDETDARGGGGGGRWPPRRRFSGGGGWRYRTATLVALGAVLLAAVGIVIGMSLHSGASTPTAHGKSSHKTTAPTAKAATPATTPTSPDSAPPDPGITADLAQAATWVNAQVGAGTPVACDTQTCPVLTASGLSATQLVHIQLNPQSLSSADIVVVTPAVRKFFSNHPALGADIAPEVLASFGPITIQPVDSAGGSAYQAEFSQDVQARIQVGKQLLAGNVTGTPVAETQLAAGDVDSRLLLAIQALAQQQAVYIVAFGDSGPGVSAGVPFRAVDLGVTDPTGAISPAVYLQSMIAILNGHATFPAFAHAGQVPLPDGQTVARVQWALPLQLGLLTP